MKMLLVLLRKEFTLELRRKSVISGIGLYIFSLTFICYLTFSIRQTVVNPATWSALFWITILFSAVNSVAKSFMGEKKGTFIYLYSLASPEQIILSKIIYNALLCMVLAVTGFILFSVFMKSPVQQTAVFFISLFLTSLGFSAALSLLSSIASKANNSNILMAILSFPVVISVLLMAIKITKNAIDGLEVSASTDELLNLRAIDGISVALAYLLFPYVWRS